MNNWKLWVPLGLGIIVVAAYFATQNRQAPTAANTGTPEQVADREHAQQANSPTAGGASASADIDAAVDTLIAGGTADQATTKDEETNAATAADSSAMGDVGTAFTDNDY